MVCSIWFLEKRSAKQEADLWCHYCPAEGVGKFGQRRLSRWQRTEQPVREVCKSFRHPVSPCTVAHKDKQGIDIICIVFHHAYIVCHHVAFDASPSSQTILWALLWGICMVRSNKMVILVGKSAQNCCFHKQAQPDLSAPAVT